jgi:hypothetical protein
VGLAEALDALSITPTVAAAVIVAHRKLCRIKIRPVQNYLPGLKIARMLSGCRWESVHKSLVLRLHRKVRPCLRSAVSRCQGGR